MKRETIVLKESAANTNYGCCPTQRPVTEYIKRGVVNLDKPKGPTSHEVASWVKKILHIGRAGHSGTLDPKVTGLLPIMLGDATRAIDALRLSGKEYICLMRLHRRTQSALIREICKEFTGAIYQTPPIKSAVKRELRIRHIYYINILELTSTEVLLQVGCEAGTYIRKLCHDIGLALGCGAHMQELRRTGAGPLTEDTAVTLHALKDAYTVWAEEGDERELRTVIQPVENALIHLPRITIFDTAVDAICHGAPLATPGITSIETPINKGDNVAIYTLKGEIVATATASLSTDDMINKKKVIAATTKHVLMDPNTYPMHWKKQRAEVV